MATLDFTSRKLHPNIRRSTSLPNLYRSDSGCDNPQSASDNTPYTVGNVLRLRLAHPARPNLTKRSVKAEIIKIFAPFSTAPVMVVRIYAPAISLKGDFVLKAFDRRFTKSIRDGMYEKEHNWTPTGEMQFLKHFDDGDMTEFVADFLSRQHPWYGWFGGSESEDDQEDDEDGICAYGEMFIHMFCLKMNRAEVEAYRRARPLQGIGIPRFVSSLQVSRFDSPEHIDESPTAIPGILIQYVPGFPLTELYESPNPPIPQGSWIPVINDAIRVTQELGRVGIVNGDTCPRNTIVHWDPITNAYKGMLIDFGHCQFRRPGWTDEEWGRYQCIHDEEGDIGREMEVWLRRKKGSSYVYEHSEYRERLAQLRRMIETERENGTPVDQLLPKG
jgi:hypothetical protein